MMNNVRLAAKISLAACVAVVLIVAGAVMVTFAAQAQTSFYNVCIEDSEGNKLAGWPFTGTRTSEEGDVLEIITGTAPFEDCAPGTFVPGIWTFDASPAQPKENSPVTRVVPEGSVQRWDFRYDPDPTLFAELRVNVIDQYDNPAPSTNVTVTSQSGVQFTGMTVGGEYTATVRKGEATVQVAEQITTVSVLSDTALITVSGFYTATEEWLEVAYRGYDEEGNQIVAPYANSEVLSPEGWDCVISYPGGEVKCAGSLQDAPEITLPGTVQIQALTAITEVFQLRATRPELSAQQVVVIDKAVKIPSEPWMQFDPGNEAEQSQQFRFWLDPSVYNTLEANCHFVSREMGLNLVVSPCPDREDQAVVIDIPRGYGYVIYVTVSQRDNSIRFPVTVPEVPGEGPQPFQYFVFGPLLTR